MFHCNNIIDAARTNTTYTLIIGTIYLMSHIRNHSILVRTKKSLQIFHGTGKVVVIKNSS